MTTTTTTGEVVKDLAVFAGETRLPPSNPERASAKQAEAATVAPATPPIPPTALTVI